ncbi:MAG: UDP-N-acetylmuramate dehydrogenase [Clostridia bacterium]
MKRKYDFLEDILEKEDIKFNESMKKHTTVKIGGLCDVLVTPTTIEQIEKLIIKLKTDNIKYYIIGNGSNLLVCDEGVNGVVIKIANKFSNIEFDDTKVTALAGCSVPRLAQEAKKEGLSGLEFACGIPGTVGGCTRMNAGCYGAEFSNIVEKVVYLDENSNIKTISNKDINFSYRNTIFKNNPTWTIISVTLNLKKDDMNKIDERMKENSIARKLKQPLEYPNFGSVFKRPEGYFVGKLIQDAGLKGYTIGGAQVSTKHTGFIVNINSATYADVISLIKHIQKIVYEKFGVKLETEVEIIGGEKL